MLHGILLVSFPDKGWVAQVWEVALVLESALDLMDRSGHDSWTHNYFATANTIQMVRYNQSGSHNRHCSNTCRLALA
jgi:hypothetical protein